MFSFYQSLPHIFYWDTYVRTYVRTYPGCLSGGLIKHWYAIPQVLTVLQNAQMIQFGQLCSLLGVSGGKMGGVLEAVMGCCVLVQGCWVVASHVILQELGRRSEKEKCQRLYRLYARDYEAGKLVRRTQSLLYISC